jgi:hypothetical protein
MEQQYNGKFEHGAQSETDDAAAQNQTEGNRSPGRGPRFTPSSTERESHNDDSLIGKTRVERRLFPDSRTEPLDEVEMPPTPHKRGLLDQMNKNLSSDSDAQNVVSKIAGMIPVVNTALVERFNRGSNNQTTTLETVFRELQKEATFKDLIKTFVDKLESSSGMDAVEKIHQLCSILINVYSCTDEQAGILCIMIATDSVRIKPDESKTQANLVISVISSYLATKNRDVERWAYNLTEGNFTICEVEADFNPGLLRIRSAVTDKGSEHVNAIFDLFDSWVALVKFTRASNVDVQAEKMKIHFPVRNVKHPLHQKINPDRTIERQMTFQLREAEAYKKLKRMELRHDVPDIAPTFYSRKKALLCDALHPEFIRLGLKPMIKKASVGVDMQKVPKCNTMEEVYILLKAAETEYLHEEAMGHRCDQKSSFYGSGDTPRVAPGNGKDGDKTKAKEGPGANGICKFWKKYGNCKNYPGTCHDGEHPDSMKKGDGKPPPRKDKQTADAAVLVGDMEAGKGKKGITEDPATLLANFEGDPLVPIQITCRDCEKSFEETPGKWLDRGLHVPKTCVSCIKARKAASKAVDVHLVDWEVPNDKFDVLVLSTAEVEDAKADWDFQQMKQTRVFECVTPIVCNLAAKVVDVVPHVEKIHYQTALKMVRDAGLEHLNFMPIQVLDINYGVDSTTWAYAIMNTLGIILPRQKRDGNVDVDALCRAVIGFVCWKHAHTAIPTNDEEQLNKVAAVVLLMLQRHLDAKAEILRKKSMQQLVEVTSMLALTCQGGYAAVQNMMSWNIDLKMARKPRNRQKKITELFKAVAVQEEQDEEFEDADQGGWTVVGNRTVDARNRCSKSQLLAELAAKVRQKPQMKTDGVLWDAVFDHVNRFSIFQELEVESIQDDVKDDRLSIDNMLNEDGPVPEWWSGRLRERKDWGKPWCVVGHDDYADVRMTRDQINAHKESFRCEDDSSSVSSEEYWCAMHDDDFSNEENDSDVDQEEELESDQDFQ